MTGLATTGWVVFLIYDELYYNILTQEFEPDHSAFINRFIVVLEEE